MNMPRTKIVATIGPASEKLDVLKEMINSGLTVARINFSHGTEAEYAGRVNLIRQAAKEAGKYVAILGDLQGPKIRIGSFVDGSVDLAFGDKFCLDIDADLETGDKNQVGLVYKDLPKYVTKGDVLLLDDGKVKLTVQSIDKNKVHTTVLVAGKLSNKKGINKLGGGLAAPALTEKDLEDIKIIASLDFDYMAVSFPKNADDMNFARKKAEEAGVKAKLVAKVERAEAVADDETLRGIIMASDVIMVARGDLGVEIGDSNLVGVQKKMIRMARDCNKAVITATQMMESMITNSMPTRAEVMDVANAVIDGTDAVMLSAESAVGAFPAETVKAMAEICLGAEKYPETYSSDHKLGADFNNVKEAVAFSAMYAANHVKGIKAIISLANEGDTARLMSRIESNLPIYVCSKDDVALRRTCIFKGTRQFSFVADHKNLSLYQNIMDLFKQLKGEKILTAGDLVLVTYRDFDNKDISSLGFKMLKVS